VIALARRTKGNAAIPIPNAMVRGLFVDPSASKAMNDSAAGKRLSAAKSA